MKTLVCLYSSNREKYADARRRLRSDPWFVSLESNPDISILEVYADPSISHAVKAGDVLRVPVEDSYYLLLYKTFEMIRYVCQEEKFDQLIKIDDTTIDYPEMFHLRKYQDLSRSFGDYWGINLIIQTFFPDGEWRKLKGITAPKFLRPGFSYYSGKCYGCSLAACKAIAQNGKTHIDAFMRDFGGPEDAFIAAMLNKYFFSARKLLLINLKSYSILCIRILYKSMIHFFWYMLAAVLVLSYAYVSYVFR